MRIHAFIHDESGLGTVEWVLMAAFVTGLAVAVVNTIAPGTNAQAVDFRDRETEVWRKGQWALANYTPYNDEGFESLYGSIENLTSTELSNLNAYMNYRLDDPDFGQLSDRDRAFLTEVDNAVSVYHAETRSIRMDDMEFDDDAVATLWQENDFDAVYQTY